VVRRHGNTVVVKCNYSGQTYLLTCANNRWKGDLANCSKGAYTYFVYFFKNLFALIYPELATLFALVKDKFADFYSSRATFLT